MKTEQVLSIMTRHLTSWERKLIWLFPLPLACYLFQDSPMTHIMLNSGDSWHLIIMHYHDSCCHAFSSWNMLLPSQSRWKKQGHCSSNVFWENTLNNVWSNCAPLASNAEHNHRPKSNSCYKTLPAVPTLFTQCNVKDIYLLCAHLSGNQLNCILFKCLHTFQSGWNNLL